MRGIRMTNVGDRMIIGILSLGYIIASIVLILVSIGWLGPINFFLGFINNINNRWILGLTSALVFVVTFSLFLSSFKSKPVKQTIIQETNLGQIKITLSALEQLILKASKSVQGVRDVKSFISTAGNVISVLVKVQVIPDINIPQLSVDLQTTIKDYLLKTSGTSVNEVKVQVTKISWDTKISRVE
jgi:uncharacterized alkaline shock family protein YloU